MREGWELKKLGDVCSYEKTKYIGKHLPYVGLEHIQSHTGKFLGSLDAVTVKSGTFHFSDKHLLYGRLRPYLNKVMIPNFEGHCSSEIFPIQVRESILREYLFYWFTSSDIVEKINDTWTGARMPRANMKEVINFEIPIPPLKEQTQIVTTLDKAFKQIDQAKANLEKNLNNAKELFQSKLNEVFSQRGEGWVEKSLGDVCTLYQGLAINKKTKHLLVEKSDIPLLRIKDLKKNTVEQYVSEVGYPKNSFVTENEIIYTRTGSLGLVFRGKRGVLHNNSFKIIPNNELTNNYLFWWLQHEAFTKIIISLASKAAQPDITHKLFKEQIISIPSIEMQNSYYLEIEQLNELSNSLQTHYQQKLNNLEELKKSILQKAFRGELAYQ